MTTRTIRLTAASLLLLVAGCSSSTDLAGDITMYTGVSTWNTGTTCEGSGGYGDISEGATVAVYDDTARLVATARLGAGELNRANGMCRLPFLVEAVPVADLYQVEVSHRGKVPFTQEDIEDGGVELSLG